MVEGERLPLGTAAVLSRWHVAACVNRQRYLEATAFIGLFGFRPEETHNIHIEIEVRTRDGLLSQPRAVALSGTAQPAPRASFQFKVRSVPFSADGGRRLLDRWCAVPGRSRTGSNAF